MTRQFFLLFNVLSILLIWLEYFSIMYIHILFCHVSNLIIQTIQQKKEKQLELQVAYKITYDKLLIC